jgi:cellulose synthase/poly-beta-1,6-N-acetylglucosamine synthase-like glycosyltransferase
MIVQFLLAAAVLQIIYMLILYRGVSQVKSFRLNKDIPVTVIVCARNEKHNLEELIPLLLQQSHENYEIIIVDDRSDDGTYDYLLSLSSEVNRLRLVRVEDLPGHVNSKKYALTLGIKAASNQVLLLTDADCRPMSDKWISHMAARFEQPEIDFVLGSSPYLKTKGLLNSFIRYESWLTAFFYIGFAANGRPYMGVGRNLAYRKKVFLEHGGFKKHIALAGGDDDLFVNQHARKRNTAICVERQAIVNSLPKTTWSSFTRQKIRHLSAGKYYRFADKFLLSIFSLTSLVYWFTLALLIINYQHLEIAGAIFAVRTLILILVSLLSGKKLGHRLSSWQVPFLDLIYLFYYLSTAARALFTKRVQWS